MLRIATILCWLALCCAGARAADAPLNAFSDLPLIDSPQLSPDGTRFAALLSAGGRQTLAIMAVDDAPPVTIRIGEGDDLMQWNWVNDEWLVIRISSTQNVQGEPWRISRALGIRASDGKAVQLAKDGDGQNASEVLWIAQDGTPRILLAVQQSLYPGDEKYYPEVFEVNVTNGSRASRAKPRQGVMDWYADSTGVVRLGIGYRDLSRTAQIVYREKAGQAFSVIDSAKLREGESLIPLPALFLAEPGKALAFSDHTGFTALYEMDLETQTLEREIHSVPGYDLDSLHADATGRELVGVSYTDTQRRTEWLEPVMRKVQRDLEAALGPARSAKIVSMSRDQQRLMVLASSATDPGTYYLLDQDKRSLEPISRVRPGLDAVTLAPVSSLRYKARDGLEIEAILTLPAGREARNLPLIVLPHGGPHARDDESFDWWAQYLAHLGYAVVQPNYRGSTGYGNRFEELGNGQWGLAMQDDLNDAIDHLARAGIADPERVCMVGGSYGGYAALRAAQRDSERIRCAVSFAGISDLAAMLRYDSQFLNSGSTRDYMKRQSPDMPAVSPINGIEQIHVPVLLVHGKRDLTVPSTQSSTFATKLGRAGKPVRYVELPEGDHYLRRAADRLRFLEEMTAFLREHNPADPPAGTRP